MGVLNNYLLFLPFPKITIFLQPHVPLLFLATSGRIISNFYILYISPYFSKVHITFFSIVLRPLEFHLVKASIILHCVSHYMMSCLKLNGCWFKLCRQVFDLKRCGLNVILFFLSFFYLYLAQRRKILGISMQRLRD